MQKKNPKNIRWWPSLTSPSLQWQYTDKLQQSSWYRCQRKHTRPNVDAVLAGLCAARKRRWANSHNRGLSAAEQQSRASQSLKAPDHQNNGSYQMHVQLEQHEKAQWKQTTGESKRNKLIVCVINRTPTCSFHCVDTLEQILLLFWRCEGKGLKAAEITG